MQQIKYMIYNINSKKSYKYIKTKKTVMKKNQGHDEGLIHDLKHRKLEFQKTAKQREYMQ